LQRPASRLLRHPPSRLEASQRIDSLTVELDAVEAVADGGVYVALVALTRAAVIGAKAIVTCTKRYIKEKINA